MILDCLNFEILNKLRCFSLLSHMKANWDCSCCGNGNDSEYPAKCKAPNGTSDQLGIHSNTLLKKAMYPVYKRCDRDYADNNFRYMLHPTPPLFNR